MAGHSLIHRMRISRLFGDRVVCRPMGRLEFTEQVTHDWERLKPHLDLEQLVIVQRLLWAGRLLDAVLDRWAKRAGVRRRGDYEVLTVVRRAEPMLLAPAEISAQLDTSPSGMTTKLDRLERAGLVQRQADSGDRRVVRIGLTNEGRALVDGTLEESLDLYESMLSTLSPEERDMIGRSLAKVLSRLDELAATRDLRSAPADQLKSDPTANG